MTVEARPVSHLYSYAGLGRYDFDFGISDEEHIEVVHLNPATGVETQMDLSFNYTVVINSESSGGYIEVTSFSLTGGQIRLKVAVPLEQPRPWSTEGELNLDKLELSLDEIVLMIQTLNDDVSSAFSDNLIFRGDWAADTLYSALNIVLHDSVFYMATLDFTSGSVFTSSNWSAIMDVSSVQDAVDEAEAASLAASTSADAAAASQLASALNEANSAINAQNSANCRQEAYDSALSSSSSASQAITKATEASDSASVALTQATRAEDEADRAESAANSVDLPLISTGSAGDALVINSAEDGYEYKTAGGLEYVATLSSSVPLQVGFFYHFIGGSTGNLTFPTGVVSGDRIGLKDCTYGFDTAPRTLLGNGANIENQSEDVVVDVAGIALTFEYNSVSGWNIVSSNGVV